MSTVGSGSASTSGSGNGSGNGSNITLTRDTAQRVANHLSNKPYIEVKDFIESISTLSISRDDLIRLLQYILKDEAAWSFAALQQVLNESNKVETPAPKAPLEPIPDVDEAATSKVEEQPDNITS